MKETKKVKIAYWVFIIISALVIWKATNSTILQIIGIGVVIILAEVIGKREMKEAVLEEGEEDR